MEKIDALNVLRYLLFVSSMATVFVTTYVGAQSIAGTLTTICDDIKAFVGILVVVLLAIGAVLYALSHVLPAAGNIKGNLQGWSLNMVVGAIVALIIYFLAPWIATQIVGFSGSGIGGTNTCT